MSALHCRNWLNQDIEKSVDWSSRRWVVAEYAQSLPGTKVACDQLLIDTKAAFKHDKTTTVTKFKVGQYQLVLKRYNSRNHWHSISRGLRRSRAKRCWQMSYAFAQAGLNVAPPLLMFEHRFGPFRMDAYFANRFLDGQELLALLPQMNEVDKLTVVSAIDSAFGKMRVAGLTHGDMKASNLIWSNGELYFIDLDAAQQHHNSITWRKCHDKDRKRLLKNWQDKPDIMALFD